VIIYEYPLNERIRTWLRLEDLFEKVAYFTQGTDARLHHAGLLAIFELAEVMGRPELRSDLIQELDRQRLSLAPLRSNPAVDIDRPDRLLDRMAITLAELHTQTGKLGQHIRDNEWLSSIRSRTGIPGGACGFDLPGYHHWLNAPAQQRLADLAGWLAPLAAVRNGVQLILQLLRESGGSNPYTAEAGVFQLMLGGRVVQLLRISLDAEWPCVPEVSANKYAVNVRLVTTEKSQKPKTYEQDVPFEMVFCSLIGCCVQA
jgi:cell division protein ZapD